MRTCDWFPDFVDRYQERMPRADWPRPKSEFWAAWEQAFIRHGVTAEVADEASRFVAERAPHFPGEHLEALLEAIRKVWSQSEVQGKPGSREAAESASRNCPDCGGKTGLAIRFRRSVPRGKPRTVELYCDCDMGRWLERAHREKSTDGRRRYHDLTDYHWLRLARVLWSDGLDNKFRYPPECWDEASEQPILPPDGLRGLVLAAEAEARARRDQPRTKGMRQICDGIIAPARQPATQPAQQPISVASRGEVPF